MLTAIRPNFYKNLNRIRISVQIFSILFLIAVPMLNLLGIHWVIGTLYSISIGQLDIVDPVMALQTVLLTKRIYIPFLLMTIVPVVLALVFGRVFCSWMCPQNTISEWVDALQKRIFKSRWHNVHTRHIENNPNPVLYWCIFAALTLLVLILGLPLFSYLSTPGIISSQMSQIILGMGVGLEIGLVTIIFAVEAITLRRFWCKYVCPVGAFLSFFRTRKTLHIHYEAAQCDCKGNSSPCQYVCPLDLAPKESKLYPYCFNCGLCISICEKTGNSALSLKFGLTENKQMTNNERTDSSLIQLARFRS